MDEAVKKYMAKIGKKGGSAKSERKAEAAVDNGKKGGRPHLVIKKANIVVKETISKTSIIGGKKVHDPHVTGWNLSYKFPDGTVVKGFYQRGIYNLKRALHVFFKSCVEPRRTEYERGSK
jgi:hypothetical protein